MYRSLYLYVHMEKHNLIYFLFLTFVSHTFGTRILVDVRYVKA